MRRESCWRPQPSPWHVVLFAPAHVGCCCHVHKPASGLGVFPGLKKAELAQMRWEPAMGHINFTTRLWFVMFFRAAGGGAAARSNQIPLKQHGDGSSAGDQDGGKTGWSESRTKTRRYLDSIPLNIHRAPVGCISTCTAAAGDVHRYSISAPEALPVQVSAKTTNTEYL